MYYAVLFSMSDTGYKKSLDIRFISYIDPFLFPIPISLYYFLHLLSRELEVTLTDRTGTLRYTLAEPVPFLRVGSGSGL